jgi:nucleobase transporter 1/2
MGMVTSWIVCAILTVTDAVPDDPSHWSYYARTDVKIKVLNEAHWFRVPYPCELLHTALYHY